MAKAQSITNPTDRRRQAQLGMPWGTACARLRKSILFMLVREAGRDTCSRCQRPILTADDLSIEHLQDWLDRDPAIFWDLGNVAFSHRSCNTSAQRRPNTVICPPGTSWCRRCKDFKPLVEFWKDRRRLCGLRDLCKPCCRQENARAQRRRRAQLSSRA